MPRLTEYVLGFAFAGDQVLLIRMNQNAPNGLGGKLNAVGGKVEPGEFPIEAMVREFAEETGLDVAADRWQETISFGRDEVYAVRCFRVGLTEEEAAMSGLPLHRWLDLPHDVMPNLLWLVPLHYLAQRWTGTLMETD